VKSFYLLPIVFVATTCASTFKLTDDQLSQRSQLTSESASASLVRFLVPPDARGGLCRQVDPYALLPSAKPTVNDGVVSFMASKENIFAEALAGGVIRAALSDDALRTLRSYTVDLKNLRKIQVIGPKDRGGSGYPPLSWGAVIVSPNEGPFFYVITEPKDVDEVVTLVSFFSPSAKLMAGPGW
jgi:hypothetical protein